MAHSVRLFLFMKDLISLIRDDNNEAVQIGSTFVTQDATDTPQDSPLAFSTTVIEIKVPERAVEFIVNPDQDLRISEDSAMSTYDVIASGTKEAVSCGRMESIYIVRDSADGTANFRFTLI